MDEQHHRAISKLRRMQNRGLAESAWAGQKSFLNLADHGLDCLGQVTE
jgi:hypothetical protein